MYAVYLRISCIKHVYLPTSVCSFAILDGYMYLRHGYMQSDLHHAVQPDSTVHLYTCSSSNRSNMDQSALPIWTKILIHT